MSEVTAITELRQKRRRQEQSSSIAGGLQALAYTTAGESPYTAMFVIGIGPDGPELIVLGRPTWDDARVASWAMGDAAAVKHAHEDETMEEAVGKGYARRVQLAREMAEQRREWEASHPHVCDGEGCARRFRSNRGRLQHERSCSAVQADAERAGQEQGLLTD